MLKKLPAESLNPLTLNRNQEEVLMSHKILFMAILALMLTALANAADITGKWVMTTPRPNGAIHQTMIFRNLTPNNTALD